MNGTFCLGTLKLASVCFVCNFFSSNISLIYINSKSDITEMQMYLFFKVLMCRRHMSLLGQLHCAIPKCKAYFLHWCIMYAFFLHFYRCFVFYSERDIYKHNWMPITSYLHVFVICYKFNLLHEFSIYSNSVNPFACLTNLTNSLVLAENVSEYIINDCGIKT